MVPGEHWRAYESILQHPDIYAQVSQMCLASSSVIRFVA